MREWIGPIAKYVLYAVFAVCVFHQALATQRETRRLLRERRRLQIEIARLHRANILRERVRTALRTDPFYVERVLRERHGYRAPGEQPPASSSELAERRRNRTSALVRRQLPREDDEALRLER